MPIVTVAEMLRRLDSFDIVSELLIILEEKREIIIKMNKSQWKEGLRSDSTPIGQYANKYYAQEKNIMNPEPGFGFMDLILTGTTVDSIDIEIKPDRITFKLVSDIHELETMYGEDILGLTYQNKVVLIKSYLFPELLKVFKQKTGME